MHSTEVRNPYQALQDQNLACNPLVLLIYTATATAVRNTGDGAGLCHASGCENSLAPSQEICVLYAWETKALGENWDLLEVCGSREKAGASGCSGGSDLHPC